MTISRNDLNTEKQELINNHFEKQTKCLVIYYGLHGKYNQCLKKNGLTEANPGKCKDQINEEYERCLKNVDLTDLYPWSLSNF